MSRAPILKEDALLQRGSPTREQRDDDGPPDRKLYRSMSTLSKSPQHGSEGRTKLKATDQQLWEQVEEEIEKEPKSRITRMHRDVMGRKVKPDVHCIDVDSTVFIYGVFFLIVANSIFIGVEVSSEPRWWYPYVENFFDAAFVTEITIRMIEKRENFFSEPFGNWKWNVFDLVIVILSLVGLVIEPFYQNGSTQSQIENGYFIIQTIRMIRVVRVLRFLRIFRELAIIGDGFFKSTEAVGWITVMLLFLMYFCAVLTTGLLGRRPGAAEDVESWFGSVVPSMLTLFQIMTLDGWVHITRTVMIDAGWGWGLFFCSFVLVASFTFLGLLSAVLTDHTITTMRESHAHKEKQLREQQHEAISQVLEIFEEMDTDGSGSLTKDEMFNMLSDPGVQDTFHCMNWHLQPSDVNEIYGILDSDQSGQIDAEEFLEGFMQLRGEARAKDLFALKMMVKKEIGDIKDTLGLSRAGPSRSMHSRATAGDQSARRREERKPTVVSEEDADGALQQGLNGLKKLKGDRAKLLQVLKEISINLELS